MKHLTDAWQTIVPPRGNAHGPLPPLLIILTVVTGLVDAFSYLSLGHVFVANMTGNVVFLAFALSGAAGFVIWASILAIGAFATGALAGGRIAHRFRTHRGRAIFAASVLQLLVTFSAFIVALAATSPFNTGPTIALVSLLGFGMGVQNATARALAVSDLTTTVLTLTITGISADSRLAGGGDSRAGRRLLSAFSMFLGALVGAVMIAGGYTPWVLLVAATLLAVVALVAARTTGSKSRWTSVP